MAYQDSSLTPYHGSEPYIFISYSHRNADRVHRLNELTNKRRAKKLLRDRTDTEGDGNK